MNRLQEIFEKQTGYMRELAPIYFHNGFSAHSDFPFDINDREAQEQLRVLAWRITEETFEAINCWNRRNQDTTLEDYREEAADVLHFFVEFCICSNISIGEICSGVENFVAGDDDYLGAIWNQIRSMPPQSAGIGGWQIFMAALARALMCLRQRPWRTDNRLTNREELVRFTSVTWYAYANACLTTGISANDIYNAYFNKQVINQKRREDAKAGMQGEKTPHGSDCNCEICQDERSGSGNC